MPLLVVFGAVQCRICNSILWENISFYLFNLREVAIHKLMLLGTL